MTSWVPVFFRAFLLQKYCHAKDTKANLFIKYDYVKWYIAGLISQKVKLYNRNLKFIIQLGVPFTTMIDK